MDATSAQVSTLRRPAHKLPKPLLVIALRVFKHRFPPTLSLSHPLLLNSLVLEWRYLFGSKLCSEGMQIELLLGVCTRCVLFNHKIYFAGFAVLDVYVEFVTTFSTERVQVWNLIYACNYRLFDRDGA